MRERARRLEKIREQIYAWADHEGVPIDGYRSFVRFAERLERRWIIDRCGCCTDLMCAPLPGHEHEVEVNFTVFAPAGTTADELAAEIAAGLGVDASSLTLQPLDRLWGDHRWN
jgi:hypothetical protein